MKKSIKTAIYWIIMIIVAIVLIVYAYFTACFELFEVKITKLGEIRDVRRNITYEVNHSNGNALDYEAVTVSKILKNGKRVYLDHFERYSSTSFNGISFYAPDTLQIILYDDTLYVHTSKY